MKPAIKKLVKKKSLFREKEPEYMVQLADPKNLRKNILESLRDIILFMQSYEKFKKVQEEKIATFNELKEEIKAINSLMDNKLRPYFPKGKIDTRFLKETKEKVEEPEPMVEEQPEEEPEPQQESPPNELEELESQLKDIENQLRNIR